MHISLSPKFAATYFACVQEARGGTTAERSRAANLGGRGQGTKIVFRDERAGETLLGEPSGGFIRERLSGGDKESN